MELLRTVAGIIDPDAITILDNLQSDLKYFESEGYFNTEERDALRHYLGMQALGERYGGSAAWVMGMVHEGFDLFMPGESGTQADVDIKNNNIALEDLDKGINVSVEDLQTKEDFRELLNKLVIPPPSTFMPSIFEDYSNTPDVNQDPYDQAPSPENMVDVYESSFLPNLPKDE